MASIIRIKRSDSNGNPSTLAAGELAYSALPGTQNNGGDRLYIGQGSEIAGNAANHIVIGGKYFTDKLSHVPGVLTTSSAIITDANNKIDILNVDNITLNGNTISSTDANGNLIFAPNGTGKISFYNAYTFPTTAGTAGYALVSDGAGGLTWAGVSTANTATNLAGGTAGQIPIQSSAGTTAFIPTGTSGQLLQAGTNTATFVSTSTLYVGRANSADAWSTSRTLTLGGDLSGSVTFDGSSNFTLTATVTSEAVVLGTDTTGDFIAAGATSGWGISGSASGESSTFTVTSNATSTNAVSTLVFRDGSGNFAAGTITANLTGVATTATNVAGGTAGQLVYQTAAGATGFAGPGTTGQLLVSGGTGAPTYTNTGSIYVGAAVSSEKWATARTVTFTGDTTGTFTIDGSANVSNVTLTIQPDSVALGTDTTGDYVATGATSGFGISGSTSGENQTFTVTSNATSTNASNTLVFRDAAGNFAATTVTANLTGVATTATNVAGGSAGQIVIQSGSGATAFIPTGTAGQLLQAGTNTATFVSTSTLYVGRATSADAWSASRTLTLAGDLSGSVSFDGSGNFTLTATVAADSVALGTDTTGNYVATGATSGFGISGSSSSEGGTFTVSSNATSTNAASTIVYRDASGNFAAGTVTANLTGVATTATNIAGGTAGQVPYQTASGATGFYGPGTSGDVLVSGGTGAPTYQNTLALSGTTAATSTNTGALQVVGGVGIGGSLYVGGEIVAQKLTIQLTTITTTLVTTDDIISTYNTTQATSTTTGALTIAGGAGIGGNLYVGGTIYGTIDGSITTATNLAGGTAGQIVYQSAAGVTGFTGPGTAGQLLVSGGTGAPTYTNTGSIYVGRANNADKWSTARTVTFTGDTTGTFTIDGSGDVSNVTLTIQPDSVALGTDTTGDYVATGATSGWGISGSTSGENQTFTVTSNATSTNANSTLVFRNAAGNFAANVVTADLVGTATTATNISGGAAGSVPYQTAAGATTFLSLGTAGKVLQVSTNTNEIVWGDIDGGTY